MLNFKKIELKHRLVLEKYLYKYGEGSCQHSFANMYCMSNKYGDEYCQFNDCLYIHRANRDTEEYRVYLAPIGKGDFKEQIEIILKDAHSYGKKVKFESVTETIMEKLEKVFKKFFIYKDCRDLYEYIYTNEKLTILPGHSLASKRTDINRFWRVYGERVHIEPITEENVPYILDFQKKWLSSREDSSNTKYLNHENIMIEQALNNFKDLCLSGIVIFIDGEICGYAFGYRISDTHYDVIVEKGDRQVKDIYRILNMELVNRCCSNIDFINREEDLGVLGLRKSKMSYYPDVLLKKFIVCEA